MVDRDDEIIERAAAELRSPVRVDVAFDAKVMAAIRASGAVAGIAPGTSAGAWAWVTRPRTVSVSPLGVLGIAAVFLAMAITGVSVVGRAGRGGNQGLAPGASAMSQGQSGSATPAMAARTARQTTVQFIVHVPSAARVTVVGDFNDWNLTATPLQHASGDLWTVTVPLVPGRYSYNFVIDGQRWVTDPVAPRARTNEFGQPSSVITVESST